MKEIINEYYTKRFVLVKQDVNPELFCQAKLLKTMIGKDLLEDKNFWCNELNVDWQLGRISQDLNILGLDFEEVLQYAEGNLGKQFDGNLMFEIISSYEYTVSTIISDFIEKNSTFNEEELDNIRCSFGWGIVHNDQMYSLGYKKSGADWMSTLNLNELWDVLPLKSDNIPNYNEDKDLNEQLLGELITFSKGWKKENLLDTSSTVDECLAKVEEQEVAKSSVKTPSL